MVQMIDTTSHTTLYPPIDESSRTIPGEPAVGDRFGDSLGALTASERGWLGLLVIGAPGESGGVGAVVVVPFAPSGAYGKGATKSRAWQPGSGAIPAVDASFGTSIGAMSDTVG
jgi:hypothetical protein